LNTKKEEIAVKKFTTAALILVLCVSLLAGCRNPGNVNNATRPDTGVTTTPTGETFNPTTKPATQPTTETTQPTTPSTTQTIPEATSDNPMGGNGETDATDGTGGTEGRIRGMMPRSK
jgi:hypothetical protein